MAHAKIVAENFAGDFRRTARGVFGSPVSWLSALWQFQRHKIVGRRARGESLLPRTIARSHLRLLRNSRAALAGLSAQSRPFAVFGAIFLLGRAGEPARPLLLARKEKLPIADMFGIYVLERLFDTASTAVIAGLGLVLFQARVQTGLEPGGASGSFATAAKTTGLFLFVGVLGAIVVLVYLRLHGTALLERRLHGWRARHGWRAKVGGIL